MGKAKRIVEILRVDRLTGDVELTAEPMPDGSFEERIAHIKAMLPDPCPGGSERYAHVRCDGCGTAVAVDYDNPQMPRGWVSRDEGDFCPRCLAGMS